MIELRPYQERDLGRLREAYAAGHRSVLYVGVTGCGKCLGIGTTVLRFDGQIVAVEDVQPGDTLMGPDSQPRRVLSTVRGRSELYRIVPARGDAWICNDVHVLTLVHTVTGDIVDIDLPSYLRCSKGFRHLYKQFAPEEGIDFGPTEPLPLDPYFLGIWYGDGTKSLRCVGISKPDTEILDACRELAVRFGLRVRTDASKSCPTHYIVGERGAGNPLLALLRSIVGEGRTLPHRYLTASRAGRLQFLAGLLDTDGYMYKSGFEIIQKQRGFADGICYLARSLGLRAILSLKAVNGERYWRVSITGDCSVIPTRIARKQAPPRKQIKCATRTGFVVEPIGVGDYAGFELDGDGHFLLGDFTVTHNTVLAAAVIRAALARANRCVFLAGRTELLDQTVDKLRRADIANVRVIQAERDVGPADAPVTVASIQTLTTTRWRDRLPKADLVIVDEVQHGPARTWARVMQAYRVAHWLGLSATPERATGEPLGDLFDVLVAGPSVRDLIALGHLVPCRVWAPPLAMDAGKLALDPVAAYQQHGRGERAVVFCLTRSHAAAEAERFQAAGIPAAMVDGTMARGRRGEALRRLAAGELRVVTSVNVLTEGVDIPVIAVAILARRFGHAGAFLQAAGRILRPAPGKRQATLIDLAGSVHEHGTPDLDRTYSLEGKAIRAAAPRDAIRQCPSCGHVFLAAATCPHCKLALPIRPAKPPRSTGVGVVDVTGMPKPPPRVWVVAMDAKRDGICAKCGRWFPAGTPIHWAKGRQPRHQRCPLPALPSATPTTTAPEVA
jgi:superfamily II DNA or RNA helicase